MSDTLDRIEAQVNLRTRVTIGRADGPELPTWVSRDDLRALVNIARAAETLCGDNFGTADWVRLREALAALEEGGK